MGSRDRVEEREEGREGAVGEEEKEKEAETPPAAAEGEGDAILPDLDR
jgi:hypothetical protein